MNPIHPAELTELAAGLNRLARQWGQQRVRDRFLIYIASIRIPLFTAESFIKTLG
ncbi:MAG: hypothetical protein NTX70_00765 [Verrucomicrobia bacterium]|jgi:hypothetical protein|nr:hypothetical protein [Verrucomicrobiota bacterium]